VEGMAGNDFTFAIIRFSFCEFNLLFFLQLHAMLPNFIKMPARRHRSPLIKSQNDSIRRLEKTDGIYLSIHYGYIGQIGKNLRQFMFGGIKGHSFAVGKNALLN
jgi:hypothetical protein